MVVDDNDDLRELYEETLVAAGFDVIFARNGGEAIALAANRLPAVIIMDLQMPGVDGWEATRQIRAANLQPSPYVIAVTAHLSESGRQDAHDAGANEFLVKPDAPEVVSEMVRRALKAAR